jgi:hypothetical protein
MTDRRTREAVEMLEKYADNLADEEELTKIQEQARAALAAHQEVEAERLALEARRTICGGRQWDKATIARGLALRAAVHVTCGGTPSAERTALDASGSMAWSLGGADDAARVAALDANLTVLCTLLRDVIGNPFRPIFLDPAWLAWNNSTIPRLAGAAYAERQLPAGTLDVARLAVLADALQEAGCDDAGFLEHLRSEGPHWRGCWAVDALLGKS